jgi:hypothetical protein
LGIRPKSRTVPAESSVNISRPKEPIIPLEAQEPVVQMIVYRAVPKTPRKVDTQRIGFAGVKSDRMCRAETTGFWNTGQEYWAQPLLKCLWIAGV